jgi:hypothetical protein
MFNTLLNILFNRVFFKNWNTMFKQVFDVESFIKPLNINAWFSKIGTMPIANNKNIKYINSLENAALVWYYNQEVRNQEWIDLTSKIKSNKIWNQEFNTVKAAYLNLILKNTSFIKFHRQVNSLRPTATTISGIKKISPDLLALQLPVMGYFGELLGSNTKKTYTKKIEYFKKGLLVVEHLDDNILLY